MLLPAEVVAVDIDDFGDAVTTGSPQTLDQNGGRSKAAKETGSVKGVLGGTRQMTVSSNGTTLPRGQSITAWVNRQRNGLEYSSSLGASGSLELVYDASGRGLNADLGSAKGVSVLFDADVSAVPYKVTLTLTDTSQGSSSIVQKVTAAGAQRVDFLFSSVSGFNPRKAVRLALLVEPQVAGDLQITKIRTLDAN